MEQGSQEWESEVLCENTAKVEGRSLCSPFPPAPQVQCFKKDSVQLMTIRVFVHAEGNSADRLLA